MENQYELLQQTLSDYRKLMKETEDKIQGVMEDLAKTAWSGRSREDIRDVLERLGTRGPDLDRMENYTERKRRKRSPGQKRNWKTS